MRSFIIVLLALIGGSSSAATFAVTNPADEGAGTLREAIFNANTTPAAPHRITFNLPAPFTISPSNGLHSLTNNILVDGSTQPGFAGTPIIRLTGTNASTSVGGLQFAGSGGGVRALRIERFEDAVGVTLLGRSNFVEGCHIFSNLTGVTVGSVPTTTGMYVRVGGLAISNRNVISGNTQVGIYVTTVAGGTLVQGNYVGLDPTGTQAFGETNNFTGILIVSASNTVGGAVAGARNVIAGNRGEGVKLLGVDAHHNRVEANFIGTDALGTTAISNIIAVLISGAPSNTITGNVLSGNNSGLTIVSPDAAGNTASYNFIGVLTNGAVLANDSGVSIQAPRNVLSYNTISGNRGIGVEFTTADATGNEIYGNVIGLAPDGVTVRSNRLQGVNVANGAFSNRIGVTTPFFFDRNVIAGNGGGGVSISGTSSYGNVVAYSRIGTDASGFLARGNHGYGVRVDNAPFTWIGDQLAGAASGNQISGNNGLGVEVFGLDAWNCRVEHNFVGLDAAGTGVVVGSQTVGISVSAGSACTIGPGRNYVAGQLLRGISVGGFCTNIAVINNVIGAATNGLSRRPNGVGVFLAQGRDIFVYDNIISGNQSNGVVALGATLSGLIFGGNLIGVGVDGTTVVSNALNGIYLLDVPGTRIGTDLSLDRNIISGNGWHGIHVGNGTNSAGTSIRNNFIGLNAAGTTVVPNGSNGVHATFTHGIEVGGPSNTARNVIAGNQYGIYVEKGDHWSIQNNYVGVDSTASATRSNRIAGIRFGASSFTNLVDGNLLAGNAGPGLLLEDQCRYFTIRGNRIGVGLAALQALPNAGPGILVSGCEKMIYGGSDPSNANRIAFNQGPGIAITSIVSGLRLQHEIYGNLIYSNAGPSIDLNYDGVTANDPAPDTDNGFANDFQNFPVLSAAVRGSTIVSGQLVSDGFFNPYRLEFFALTPTQGLLFVGATNIVLPGSSTGTFTYAFALSPPTGSLIYATASTTNKGTSEFSAPVLLTEALTDSDFDLMPDVWETAYGLNPSVSNAVTDDADGDGFADVEEWIADTAPNAASSYFRITAVTGAAPRVVLLPTSATRVYSLDRSDISIGPGWSTLLSNVPGSGGTLALPDGTASTTSSFYRVGVKRP